jgi:CheY-like chemotaxis protein
MNRDAPADVPRRGVRLLLADDDAGVRALIAALLREAPGIGLVVQAEDGTEALALADAYLIDVAVLDMNMPRLDGIEAARRLRALRPTMPIALQSSDIEQLSRRAADLGLPLFDKVDFDALLAWVEKQARVPAAHGHQSIAPLARTLDLCCDLCGYGIVSRSPPMRCPMCGGDAVWAKPSGWDCRRAALHERRAG